MHIMSTWRIDNSKILTRSELAVVLSDLRRKARWSDRGRMNLALVRLACCCGLRVSEIAQLRLDDVVVETARPHIHVRPAVGKGHRGRRVPLWWDAGTLADLTAWKARRVAQGATDDDYYICSQQANRRAQPLKRHAVRRRSLAACNALGPARLR
jgi:integrase